MYHLKKSNKVINHRINYVIFISFQDRIPLIQISSLVNNNSNSQIIQIERDRIKDENYQRKK